MKCSLQTMVHHSYSYSVCNTDECRVIQYSIQYSTRYSVLRSTEYSVFNSLFSKYFKCHPGCSTRRTPSKIQRLRINRKAHFRLPIWITEELWPDLPLWTNILKSRNKISPPHPPPIDSVFKSSLKKSVRENTSNINVMQIMEIIIHCEFVPYRSILGTSTIGETQLKGLILRFVQ